MPASDYEVRDNSGTLWKNNHKTDGDNKPNMTGKIRVEGKDFYISAWTKTSQKSGERFQSLAVRPVDEQAPQAKPAQQNRNSPPPIDEDSIPF